MAKQVKIKKLLRTDDAFFSTSEKAYNFFLTHTRGFIYGACGLLLLFVVILVVVKIHDRNLEKAALATQEALTVTEPNGAVAALTAVIDQYPGSPSARVAALALVGAQVEAQNYAQAAATLEEFISSLKPGEESLKILTLVSLGQLYEDLNDLEKAGRNYRLAQAELQGVGSSIVPVESLKTEVAMSVARVQEAAGQIAESIQTYETLKLTYPNRGSFQDFLAQYRLAMLKASVPSSAVSSPPAATVNAAVNATTDNASANAADNATTDNAADNATTDNAAANATTDNAADDATTDNAAANATADNASANATADNAAANATTDKAATNATFSPNADNAAAPKATTSQASKPKPKAKAKPKARSKSQGSRSQR
ncbi:MAG: outer membrane protein assembly factor BamD [Deltaproteobacteria bacterium]|jgi:hypothetical protein|nr:outer membrane protein assembly factor BamD [Deltaproteobacteria bacterium]